MGCFYFTGHMALAVADQPLRPVVQPLSGAHAGERIGELPRQGVQQGIVPIDDHEGAGLDMVEDLALGLQDLLPGAEVLDVGVADVGHQHHIGLHQGREVVDLPGVVHAQLQHGNFVLPAEAQQGHGHADLVVQVALGLEHPVLLPQHRRHHVLGGGLTHRARQGHHRYGELFLVILGQIPQGPLGGVHLDIELARQIALPLPLGKAARSAPLQGGVDVGVAVESLPHQGHKQGPSVDGAAVRLHPSHHPVDIPKLSQQLTADRVHDFTYGHRLHNPFPLLIFPVFGPPERRAQCAGTARCSQCPPPRPPGAAGWWVSCRAGC